MELFLWWLFPAATDLDWALANAVSIVVVTCVFVYFQLVRR